MADQSKIEWTDATWNPITGCSVVSPGCTNCYAMSLAGTRLKHHPSRKGLTVDTKAGPVWNGQVRLNEGWLDQPLRWRRPRMIFVCAHGDLFHPSVSVVWLDRVFARMALAGWHTFQALTKRPSYAHEYLTDPITPARIAMAMATITAKSSIAEIARGREIVGRMQSGKGWPLPNVWLGVSAEDQTRADERVPDLLATPAAVRFVSAEPLLGPIDFTKIRRHGPSRVDLWDVLTGFQGHAGGGSEGNAALNWIIVGGESGPNARPMHRDWEEGIRLQCEAAGVAYFRKQWGEWKALDRNEGEWPIDEGGFIRLRPDGTRGPDGWPMQRVGKKAAGRLLDGVEHNGMPEARHVG